MRLEIWTDGSVVDNGSPNAVASGAMCVVKVGFNMHPTFNTNDLCRYSIPDKAGRLNWMEWRKGRGWGSLVDNRVEKVPTNYGQSNNTGELWAIELALRWILENKPELPVEIISDSKYALCQLLRIHKRNKNQELLTYMDQIVKLCLSQFNITFRHTGGHVLYWNEYADRLANHVLRGNPKPIAQSRHLAKTHCKIKDPLLRSFIVNQAERYFEAMACRSESYFTCPTQNLIQSG